MLVKVVVVVEMVLGRMLGRQLRLKNKLSTRWMGGSGEEVTPQVEVIATSVNRKEDSKSINYCHIHSQ